MLNRAEMIICLMLFLVLSCGLTARRSSQASSASNTASSPAPTPRCRIYDEIYPATEAAYKSQHVTPAEKKEIERWALPASPSQERLVQAHSPSARPPSASERRLVRWMRDSYSPGGLIVFVARPVDRYPQGYSPWIALNTNLIIDMRDCSVIPYPTA
jgi:hypothetical protein